ncbi:MAG: hypothetical protein Q4A94_12095, partial [Plesiomonas sp.]|nr:hypothetical protein [Plesiomonas sp.]
RYKYITRYPYGPNELYDLQEDPGETVNLLKEESWQQLGGQMKLRLEQWFAQYVDPAIDGAKEPVYGSGQIGLAGLWGDGTPAHSCDAYIQENPNFQPYRLR